MAEWQTRQLQVLVSERAWGFKSPLAHDKSLALQGISSRLGALSTDSLSRGLVRYVTMGIDDFSRGHGHPCRSARPVEDSGTSSPWSWHLLPFGLVLSFASLDAVNRIAGNPAAEGRPAGSADLSRRQRSNNNRTASATTIATTSTIVTDTSNSNATMPATTSAGMATSAVWISHAMPSTIQSRVEFPEPLVFERFAGRSAIGQPLAPPTGSTAPSARSKMEKTMGLSDTRLRHPMYERILAALDTVAARQGAMPGQVALAWQMRQPAITAPIASAAVAVPSHV